MFAGYGTATFALKQLGIEHELIGFSEIDKYAIQCFKQNHGSENLGSCRDIDSNKLPDFDLLTGGTPCQDFSMAGKREGMTGKDGSQTRSGLVVDFARILKAKQPKYFLWENVKGVLSLKDKNTGEYVIDKIIEMFCEAGYKISLKLLNTKDYGIPQSRDRVFVVGVRSFKNLTSVNST